MGGRVLRLGLWLLAALLMGAAPAAADTAIYYSKAENAYGWCVRDYIRDARSCARKYCEEYGSDCESVAECGGGWGAVALAEDPNRGIGAVCGMGNSFSARGAALTKCMVTSNGLCWTDVTFNGNGSTASKDSDGEFDLTFLIQGMLQVSKYDPGTADGEYGPRTRDAIGKFQTDIGVPMTGRADGDTFDRLLDAMGGVGRLVRIVDRDVVQAGKFKDAEIFADSPRPRPQMTMGEEMSALSDERRLAALATNLKSSGTACTVPARSAQLLGDDAASTIWNIECAEGWYTLIFSADGSRVTMGGKSTMKDSAEETASGGEEAGKPDVPRGTPGNSSNDRVNRRPGN